MVHEKKVLKNKTLFSLFPCFVFLNGNWSFIWTNLKPLHPNIPYVQIGWNWIRGSRKKKILVYLFIVSSLFFNYLPCKRKLALLFNKLESPSPKHTKTCSIQLKLAAWFFKFLKYQTLLLTLSNYVPFEELNPYLNKFTNPSPKHLVPRLIEIGPVVLENMILKH